MQMQLEAGLLHFAFILCATLWSLLSFSETCQSIIAVSLYAAQATTV